VVFDASRDPDAASVAQLSAADGGAVLAIVNKADLIAAPPAGIAGAPVLAVSAKTGAGLPELLRRLEALAADVMAGGEGVPLTRLRHRLALTDSADALTRAAADGPGAEGAGDSELVAEDLRLAARALGRVTGRVDVEDLLDVIFNDFCIGK
jgi:tRNA modification GTPase